MDDSFQGYRAFYQSKEVAMLDRRNQYQRVPTQHSDSKASITEDFEIYRQYYSSERLPHFVWRGISRQRVLLTATFLVILFIFLHHKSYTPAPMKEDRDGVPPTLLPGLPAREAMPSVGAELRCSPSALRPSPTPPTSVNQLRPADIRVIAALGDSITAGSFSKNFREEGRDTYFGNSFVTGADQELAEHVTLANVLRQFNPLLVGCSKGEGYGPNSGFNVAVGGKTCRDLMGQAVDLVQRMEQNEQVNMANDWKLISLFIGTNDIGNLSCYKDVPFIPSAEYLTQIEETLLFLKERLPKSLVSIISMWNPQLAIEAGSIILEGKRKTCGHGDAIIAEREGLCTAYRDAAYRIQNDSRFHSDDFTVVVQGFMDGITDAYRNSSGEYDLSFYADDVFHLSKKGNALLAKWLWNGLLEPVGQKTTKARLEDEQVALSCPTEDNPYIRTVGNSLAGNFIQNQ